MKYHKMLPSYLLDFIKIPDRLNSYLPKTLEHDWNYVNISDFFSNDGILWFADRGIRIKADGFMFSTYRDSHHYHTDLPTNKWGLNFVIQPGGRMEWTSMDNVDSDPLHTIISKTMKYGPGGDMKLVEYTKYDGNYIIEETWSDSQGRVALVDVRSPHRIKINQGQRRVTLSLRTHNDDYSHVLNLFTSTNL